jgi:hypothetical protein
VLVISNSREVQYVMATSSLSQTQISLGMSELGAPSRANQKWRSKLGS